MRTKLFATLCVLVVLTIVLTILFSDSPQPTAPVTGMNVAVEEGKVQVSSGTVSDTIHAGEIAKITPGGDIQKDSAIGKSNVSQNNQSNSATAAISISNTTSAESTNKMEITDLYWISGYVLNEEGKYLANSYISCSQTENDMKAPPVHVVTNQEGYYTIGTQEAGTYSVTSSPSAEYFEKTDQATVSEESRYTALNFMHEKGASAFKGRVITKETGAPIAGAEVMLRGSYQRKGETHSNPSSVSGMDGRFAIRNLTEGTFNLFARADGYIDYDALQRKRYGMPEPLSGIQITPESLQKEYTVKMEEAGAVTVRVVDTNQSPVPDASVVAHAAIQYGERDPAPFDTYQDSDERGVCTFTNIPPGKVMFHAEKDGHGETISEVVETGSVDFPSEVTIELGASSSISGRIVYQDGSPAAEWSIFVHNVLNVSGFDLGSFMSDRVETDEYGNYEILGLGKGQYKYYLSKEDENGRHRVFPEQIIPLESGEQKSGVDLEIIEGTESFSGIVLSQDKNPVPGAKVTVHTVGEAGPNTVNSSGIAITDDNGEFTVPKLHKKSNVMVSVEADGYKSFGDGFPMDEYVTITLSPSNFLAGIVLDRSTRQPIPGATVILRNPYSRDRGDVTDVNGAFQFNNFSPGNDRIFAMADGYANSDPIPIESESGESIDSIAIEMEKANEFRGIVVDVAGNSIPGAIVGLESRMKLLPGDEKRGYAFSETYRTQEDGSFVIPNRGRYADGILIRHEQFALAKFPLPAEWNNEEPPLFHLTPGGSIEGVVINELQEPAAGCQIHCFGGLEGLYLAIAVTDRDGYYRIDHLPESNYDVHLSGGDMMQGKHVSISEGQTTRADFSYVPQEEPLAPDTR